MKQCLSTGLKCLHLTLTQLWEGQTPKFRWTDGDGMTVADGIPSAELLVAVPAPPVISKLEDYDTVMTGAVSVRFERMHHNYPVMLMHVQQASPGCTRPEATVVNTCLLCTLKWLLSHVLFCMCVVGWRQCQFLAGCQSRKLGEGPWILEGKHRHQHK